MKTFLPKIHMISVLFSTVIFFTSVSFSQESANPYPAYSAGSGYAQDNSVRGQLRPSQYTVLASGLSARLNKFPVVRGEYIKKGQEIAVFECSYEKAEEMVALSKLEAAQARYEVNKRLAKLNNISGIDLDLSRVDLSITKGELKKIQATLNECVVHAPFSGMVVVKHVQAYQYITKGEPLLELVDVGNLEVEIVLPSRWLVKVKLGTPFKIHIDETDQNVAALVDRIIGTIDPVSQTVHVIGVLKNPPDDLLPGMSGKVDFQWVSPPEQ